MSIVNEEVDQGSNRKIPTCIALEAEQHSRIGEYTELLKWSKAKILRAAIDRYLDDLDLLKSEGRLNDVLGSPEQRTTPADLAGEARAG